MDTAQPELAFRFATPDDVPAIVGLVESAYRGEPSREGWTTEADLLHGQRTDPQMVSDAVADPGREILLAQAGDALVACCELTRPQGARPHEPAGAAYLGMFAVDPALQAGGIGRSVLDESARIAREEWHAAVLELTTLRQREELIAWYERRGFSRTGEVRPFPYGDERYGLPQRDDIEMVVLALSLR